MQVCDGVTSGDSALLWPRFLTRTPSHIKGKEMDFYGSSNTSTSPGGEYAALFWFALKMFFAVVPQTNDMIARSHFQYRFRLFSGLLFEESLRSMVRKLTCTSSTSLLPRMEAG